MTFLALQARLVEAMRFRIRNGEITERAFARRAGISQPHIHHVLRGSRGISPAMSDQILEGLGLTVEDLADVAAWPEELTVPPPDWPLRGRCREPVPPSASS